MIFAIVRMYSPQCVLQGQIVFELKTVSLVVPSFSGRLLSYRLLTRRQPFVPPPHARPTNKEGGNAKHQATAH
jgi:hypothetical protein